MTRQQLSKNFYRDEFTCNCGCGYADIDGVLVQQLQTARNIADIPFRILSGCRCLFHNRTVGGVESSVHLLGKAADIEALTARDQFVVLSALLQAGFTRIGLYKRRRFIHVDTHHFGSYLDKIIW